MAYTTKGPFTFSGAIACSTDRRSMMRSNSSPE
ncbi:hypothetical protein ALO_09349 [Acetonema longum DSM 6540]|uniref:Uncharacterized protein n=1 Tax=Acetonema longum DSM 6540 TaxID=1009370 RepID=F7NIG7_9FIRM|nr:hypothetical protein ALO_09349 [Acetonema longum DSM 6540]